VPSPSRDPEALPPLRDDVRTVAWWLAVGFAVGGTVGGLVGGVGGRLVMLVLRLASDADGVVSDDGFVIGQFTLADSLQLYAGMALAGAINGMVYVAARLVLPRRGRVALWGAVGAAVVGSLVVNTDGVDFVVLEPLWFAIAAFVALPGLAAVLVAWIVERVAAREPWRVHPAAALVLVPASPGVLALPVGVLAAAAVVALGRIRSLRRLPGAPALRAIALAALAATVVAGAVDLARDTAEIL
jgi:hypothetical protein